MALYLRAGPRAQEHHVYSETSLKRTPLVLRKGVRYREVSAMKWSTRCKVFTIEIYEVKSIRACGSIITFSNRIFVEIDFYYQLNFYTILFIDFCWYRKIGFL